MLDLNDIRRDPDRIRTALAKREIEIDFGELLSVDEDYRKNQQALEQSRAERKGISGQISQLRRAGESAAQEIEQLRSRSQAVGERIAERESRAGELSAARQSLLDALPNLPDDDVPAGGKDANQVLRVVGDRPDLDAPLDHVQLAEGLGLVDYKRGAKLGGNGSWIYTGVGAQLEWALLNYFVQTHLRDGYTFVLPPHLLTGDSGYAAGQFPKFAEDVYVVEEDEQGKPSKFLIPTSETALVSIHRDEILRAEELPRKYFAYSPCYRKEIGGYRTYERGTLRGHQFNKVEMFQFTRPEDSLAAHEEMLEKAEELMRGLGLHYRVSLLAAGDTSASMTKTFDVEAWIPSIGQYLEVSSVSNSRDYQARRARIRYRGPEGKPALVHTLNGSGLATSRLLPAVLEQNQQADGSVLVPEVLHAWAPARISPVATRTGH
ncbi:MAG: seryl-tRNA synthetase [Actinomycetota bacterium]|nr:seryl-tRNA synthetase [Actinomycetota bacterium]